MFLEKKKKIRTRGLEKNYRMKLLRIDVRVTISKKKE